MQVPLQRVVGRATLTDEPLAVIDQQPDVELRAVQRRRRQWLHPFGQRGPGNGQRVDAIRLAALAGRAPRRRHQPRRDANDPLAARDQEPLQRPGDMAAILKRPRPLAGQARAHKPAHRTRALPTATVISPSICPVAASTAAIVCELLCVSAPSTII